MEYQLELKQIVDHPRCRIYREFLRNLMNDRDIRTNGSSLWNLSPANLCPHGRHDNPVLQLHSPDSNWCEQFLKHPFVLLFLKYSYNFYVLCCTPVKPSVHLNCTDYRASGRRQGTFTGCITVNPGGLQYIYRFLSRKLCPFYAAAASVSRHLLLRFLPGFRIQRVYHCLVQRPGLRSLYEKL